MNADEPENRGNDKRKSAPEEVERSEQERMKLIVPRREDIITTMIALLSLHPYIQEYLEGKDEGAILALRDADEQNASLERCIWGAWQLFRVDELLKEELILDLREITEKDFTDTLDKLMARIGKNVKERASTGDPDGLYNLH